MVGTFSILGRIGGDATYEDRGNGIGELVLSVSSVGSEAMQRRESLLPLLSFGAFSILGRIGGDATIRSLRLDARVQARAFSILGRIGGDAT